MPASHFLICLALVAASSSSSCPESHRGPEGACIESNVGAGEEEEREDESLLVLHHSRSRTAKSDVELVETDISHPAPQAQPRLHQPSFEALPAAAQDLTQAQANHSWPGGGGFPGYHGYGQGQPGGFPGNAPGQSGGYQGYYPGYGGGNYPGYPGYNQGPGGGQHGNAPWQSGGYEGYYPGSPWGNSYPGYGGGGSPWPWAGYEGYYQGQMGGHHGLVLQQSEGDQANTPHHTGDKLQSSGNQNHNPGSGYSSMEDRGLFPQREQHLCDGSLSGTVDRRRRMGNMCSCRRRQSSDGVQRATDDSNYGWACKDEQMVAAKLQYTDPFGLHFGQSKSCSKHPACREFEGDCCPTEDNIMLECCQTWSR